MKLNFTFLASALASPRVVNVEDHITRADQVLTGGFGTYLECPYGRVMRGTCSSGNDKEHFFTKIKLLLKYAAYATQEFCS